MAYSVLIPQSIQAKDNDALNKSAIGTIAVAGGGLVSATPSSTAGDDRWTIATPTTATLTGLYMAYNPDEKYTVLADGSIYAGLSADPRNYTNLANRTCSIFKPKVGDEIVITVDGLDTASQSTAVVGDFLEGANGQTTFTRIASATGATAGRTSFKIAAISTLGFPAAGIGDEFVKTYKAVCVQE